MKKIYGIIVFSLYSLLTTAQKNYEPSLANPTYIKSVTKDNTTNSPPLNNQSLTSGTGIFENTLPKLIPATPEAATLGKYGNVPVGHYTGVPNISIPLYQISQKDLTLDLGISYHSGGIRVEEIAPWTGLGWSITGLGTITRTIRGNHADEHTNGYINIVDNLPQIYNWYLQGSHRSEVLTFCQRAADPSPTTSLLDTEADLFTFNFGKYAGKFFYDRNNAEFYTIPRQNLKLEHAIDYRSWTITTEEGIKYVFAAKDYTNSVNNSCVGIVLDSDNDVTTSWQLTQIISPTDANNKITISYTNEVYSLKTLGGATKKDFLYTTNTSCPCNFSNTTTNCITETNYTATKVNEIVFRNGSIKFDTQANNRCDLANTKALDRITIYDANNNIVKKIAMNYSYFGALATASNCQQDSFIGRLRLDSLTIFGTSSLKMPPYIFNYSNEIPPYRLSYGQDYWGFYNGALTNTNLVADYFYQSSNAQFKYLAGANRKPNHTLMPICQLKEIVYPTGGKTVFEFEGNKARSTVSTSACDPSRCLPENTNTQYQAIGFRINDNTFDVANFTINQPSNCTNRCQGGVFSNLIAGGAAIGTSLNDVQYQLTSNSTGATIAYISSSFNQYIHLPNGSYTLSAIYNGSFTPADIQRIENTYCTLAWDEMTNANDNDVLIGGLRVKKITDIDQHGNQHYRDYVYTQENSTLSSGIVSTIPQNTYLGFLPSTGTSEACILPTCVGAYRSAESVYPLITTQGANVGYTRVSVAYSGNTNVSGGKSIYTYSPVITHVAPNETPIVPPYMVEWKEGLPFATKQLNTADKILQQDSLGYYGLNTPSNLYKETVNIKVHKIATTQIDDGSGSTFTSSYFSMNKYRTPTDWLYQNFSQERTYHSDNINYTKHEKFVENNNTNLMPSLIKQVNSVGDTLKTVFKYPHDFQMDSTIYSGMVINGQTASVIQQEEFIRKVGVNSYNSLAKKLNLYALFYNSFYAPNKVLTQENGGILTQRIKMEYTPEALMSSYTESNGIKTALTWYGVNDLGKRDLLKSMIKGEGNTIAQTTTYDYKPLVGMISQTDPKGLTNTFEYDALNRLETIKDSEGKIAKNYSYQYSGDRQYCAIPAPVITGIAAASGCQIVLSASGCYDGTITWSNGQTGSLITVASVSSPTYTATCTTTCTSPVSNALAGLTYPAGWNANNIGTNVNGCIVLSGNMIKMQANSSGGIGSPSNDFHYFYNKQFSGNVTMITKVNNLTSLAGVRAGVIIKNGLGLKDVFFSIIQDGDPASHVVGKIHRSTPNANIDIWQYQNGLPTGIWLKVKKVGNLVQSYYSIANNPSISNDIGWVEFLSNTFGASPSMTWGSTFQVGLTLENPTANSPAEVTFTNVQIDNNGNVSNL